MENELLPADECCAQYKAEVSFLKILEEYDLVEVVYVNKQSFLHADTLPQFEKFLRLHYDLDLNAEGIEVVDFLLKRIKDMRNEIDVLKNRLQVYE